MFKSILLATDGSAHAKRAADIAADIAATYDAELTIINVMLASMTLEDVSRMPQAKRFSKDVIADIERLQEILRYPAASEGVLLDFIPAPQSAIKALAEEILNDTEAAARKKKVANVRCVAVEGNPAEEILTQAEATGADLIVMGTRGLSDMGGLMLGSVSHKVIHLSKCPCLTVK